MERRESFNLVANLYDQARPSYPVPLANDLMRLAALPVQAKILEIGCGTGQATQMLCGRGYSLLCLDIGADLIALAAQRCKQEPPVQFAVTSFENWTPMGTPFDLMMAANCWHWIDPKVRYRKAAVVLAPSGMLTLIANKHVNKEEGFFGAVQEVYDQAAPSMQAIASACDRYLWKDEDGLEYFRNVERLRYPWTEVYSAQAYLRLLGTYSDHIALPIDERNALFSGIVDLMERKYGGKVTKQYEATLTLYRGPVIAKLGK